MISKKISIILASTAVATVLGIVLLVYSSRRSYKYNPDDLIEHYSATVKFITAPVVIYKEIRHSDFNQEKQPLHWNIKYILTHSEWSKDLNDGFIKIHSLLDVAKTQNSNPLYDIIDKLAEKLDAERKPGNTFFKCIFVSSLTEKKSGSIIASSTKEFFSIEARAVQDRINCPGSMECIFLKAPELRAIKEKRDQIRNSEKLRWDKQVLPSAAAIFSHKNINQEDNVKRISLTLTFRKKRNVYCRMIIKAILYLDKTDSNKGVYKTEVFREEDNIMEKCERLFRNEKLKALHFIYNRIY
ncbi:hypothetical protein ENBRE01_1858 [Enteropsectra breve]|nr:hypothetical protein ENBRE01_1858 [Enteropsectra breve]